MDVKTLAVVGAGQMGAGIAQVAAQSGLRVVLVDVSSELVQRGLGGIRAQLDKAVSKGKLEADEAQAALSPPQRRLARRDALGATSPSKRSPRTSR